MNSLAEFTPLRTKNILNKIKKTLRSLRLKTNNNQ